MRTFGLRVANVNAPAPSAQGHFKTTNARAEARVLIRIKFGRRMDAVVGEVACNKHVIQTISAFGQLWQGH
jgi:hypothetical protein